MKRVPMHPRQIPLFSPDSVRPFEVPFPSTRYQGSKRALVEWIWEQVRHLAFDSALDVFGGTGAVSHLFKTAGKKVIYNDVLRFNQQIGLALIANDGVKLTDSDLDMLLIPRPDVVYPRFIETTFAGIYFTDEENRWLDRVVWHIDHLLSDPIRQALARFALFQACLIKRPYNLFHRANLYMRMADVERSFGNKRTWDTPIETHFRAFVAEANRAVFDNGQRNQAIQGDALETPVGADLVYLDPPYLNARGVGVDYRDFYHFLEGLTDYATWPDRIDHASKHRRLQPQRSAWNSVAGIADAFEGVVARHRESILVISYRDDGIPSKDTLVRLLRQYKRHVREAAQPIQYALAHKRSRELLLIAE